jgi:hypothetical protein
MVHLKQSGISYILLFLCCAVYIFFRVKAGNTYGQMDEIIPVGIMGNILKTGCWDTNWVLADLPQHFKYDQYNFSSYILFSTVIVKILAHVLQMLKMSVSALIVLRILSVLFHVITILLTYAIGKSLFYSRRIGIFAAWLAATFPLLFQDSLYGRPESFTAMLTLLVVLLIAKQLQKPKILGFFVMGGLIGFLIAAKVTFLVLIALPCIVGFKHRNEKRRFYIWLLVLVIGLGIGFILGVPYALNNWSSYISGVTHLFSQYKGAHRPHGLPDGNVPERLVYAWRYFSAIGAGGFIVLAVLGWLLLLKERLYAHFFIVGLFFMVVVYFSIKPVFFERNFSFAIPILGMCVGFAIFWGIDRLRFNQTVRMVLLGAAIVAVTAPLLLFLWKLNIQVLSGQYEKRHLELCGKLSNQYRTPCAVFGWLLSDIQYQRFKDQLLRDEQSNVYEIYGANDTYTRHYLRLAEKKLGMRIIAELPSPFQTNGLPPSTLYTDHAPQFFYLTHVSNLHVPSQ